jgi:hypothetical protein
MTGAHLSEETLVWHYYGDDEDAAETARHLDACRLCQGELERLKQSLQVIEAWPVPERDAGYGERVWQRVARAAEGQAGFGRRLWRRLTGAAALAGRASPAKPPPNVRPRARWVLAGGGGLALAGMLSAAFFLGRASRSREVPEVAVVSPALTGAIPAGAAPGSAVAAQQRILAAALSEHLAQSERILLELVNWTEDPAGKGAGDLQGDAVGEAQVDLADEQARASGLLDDNRLYRQTAARQGQLALASVLEELERVLLDVARGPRDLSADQMAVLRARVDDQGLVFKVRILEARLRELGNRPPEIGTKG